MGQVTLTINETPYQIGCRDGDEERLKQLSVVIDERVTELAGSLGRIGEAKLMLMAALLLLDEAAEEHQRMPTETELNAQAASIGEAAEEVARIAAALETT